MNKLFLLVFCVTLVIQIIEAELIAEISIIQGITKTNYRLWQNFVGLNLYLDQIRPLLTNKTFIDYIANSGVYSDNGNKWSPHIEVPLGYKHNCDNYGALSAQNFFLCTQQIGSDQVLLKQIGSFAKQTSNLPFWTLGFDYQFWDVTVKKQLQAFYKYIKQIFDTTKNGNSFQMINNADIAVSLHYKKSTYTPQLFLQQMQDIQRGVYGAFYEGPGITQQAGQQWLKTVQQLGEYCQRCIWSAQAIIFTDPSLCTINNLLSQNYTRQSLKRRFTRGSYSISDFSGIANVRLSKVKLTADNGKQNVTNTLAAAFWQLDYILEFALMNTWDINIQSQIKADNYQHVFTPDIKPGALYYGMLFASIIQNQTPQIILPQIIKGTSSLIKAWGFETISQVRILAINKDQNQSLSGYLTLQMNTQKIKCIYLSASNLNSTSGITIGGINFDTSPSGTGVFKQYIYESTNKKFNVDFKYAQAVLCSGQHNNKAFPSGVKMTSTVSQSHIILGSFVILLMICTIIM